MVADPREMSSTHSHARAELCQHLMVEAAGVEPAKSTIFL